MAITETWFVENLSVNIIGYHIYRRYRTNQGYGGVCIYVRNDLTSCEVEVSILNNSVVEQIWCTIRVCNEKILLGCIYNPDPNKENSALLETLSKVDRLMMEGHFTGLLLTGDFNYSSTKWDEYGFPSSLKKSEIKFVDSIRESNLVQHVNFPTFVMPNSESKSTFELLTSLDISLN